MNTALSHTIETRILSECLESLESGGRPQGGGTAKGDVPSIGGEHLNDSGSFDFDSMKFIPYDYYERMHKGKIKTNDVLIVKDGATTGKVSFVNAAFPYRNAAVNEHVFILRTKSALLQPHYAFFFLHSTLGKHLILKDFHGSAQGGITRGFVTRIRIPVPPLPIQKQIAAILDKADAARQKRRQANQVAEKFLQSAFLEMFGDPVKNPKGWGMSYVEAVTTSHDNRRIPIESSIREGRHGDYPYYGASGIIDYVDDFIFDFETVLIGEDGANLLARSSPISFIARGKYWVNNHAHVLAPKDSMTREYLVYFFNRTDLKPFVSGSAQPKLTAANLSRIPIPVPPVYEQEKFVALVEKAEGLRLKQRESERELDNLFGSLMQRAFRGELVG